MLENAANLVTVAGTNNMTEWGVALLYESTIDGAQNNTIQSNLIDLNRTYQNTFGIYSNSSHTRYSCDYQRVRHWRQLGATTECKNLQRRYHQRHDQGIFVVGPNLAADQNNSLDIGGTTAGTANNITNFGTTPTFSAYANVVLSVNGIQIETEELQYLTQHD